MVKLTRIYTGGGDTGETSLGDGQRVPKHSVRVAAYGTADEAGAVIGIARTMIDPGADPEADPAVDTVLARIQNDLFDLGADFCTPEDGKRGAGALRITEEQVSWLEGEIDRVNEGLGDLESFILPGGTPLAAHLHLARTVVRRAERLATELATQEKINGQAIKYLNRLSDLMFVMARAANRGGKADVLWVPGGKR
ncbi:MAG: cob(I)yrinic acid a,c-diamide adenosyltransferase [Alphaproteobacteria bacterium]|jgi:cob(I)alamin adenosyltransferase|nr:cob(I)yrinic acid a,c-diamide adenosyltransferase [Alphaproteobacteria bacterium]